VDSDFTAEDPLALDYLAQQVGLWLFRGFTTRTARAQNYVVVAYGLRLAEKAVDRYGYPGDDETRTRLFERWERFWALATLECRGGQLARGDEDAMRGVRGATRAWFPGPAPLPLDFPLISRQNELGGLGAYLSSLRDYGQVFSGSLRVTLAAHPLLAAFWCEKGERDSAGQYEDYALEALDLGTSKIKRQRGRLTLAGVGKASRLSSLVRRSRTKQQTRLWEILFLGARDDSTLPIAERLIAAHEAGVVEPEPFCERALAGQWGSLPPAVAGKMSVALAFGRAARELLGRFDRACGYLDQHGCVADIDAVARASFPAGEMGTLRSAAAAVLDASESRRFRKLQFHGPDFLTLLAKLTEAGPRPCLELLLLFHRAVQRTRRGGGAWLREDQDKLVVQVPGYNGYYANQIGEVVLQTATTTAVAASTNPSVYGQPVTFTATMTANAAGAATPTGTVQFVIDGQNYGAPVALSGGTAAVSDAALAVGSHTVAALYGGDAGSLPSDDTAAPLIQVVSQADTTTAVASSLNPSDYGQAVTFTATVTVNGPGSALVASPTGTITFYDNGTAFGTATLGTTGGVTTATLTTTAFQLAAGSHPITAAYTSGDGNFHASPASAALTQTVLSAQQQDTVLTNRVNSLVNSGALSSGNGSALTAKLSSATSSLNAGDATAGVNQLNGFINQVNAFQ
jgi:hypothetical protein